MHFLTRVSTHLHGYVCHSFYLYSATRTHVCMHEVSSRTKHRPVKNSIRTCAPPPVASILEYRRHERPSTTSRFQCASRSCQSFPYIEVSNPPSALRIAQIVATAAWHYMNQVSGISATKLWRNSSLPAKTRSWSCLVAKRTANMLQTLTRWTYFRASITFTTTYRALAQMMNKGGGGALVAFFN